MSRIYSVTSTFSTWMQLFFIFALIYNILQNKKDTMVKCTNKFHSISISFFHFVLHFLFKRKTKNTNTINVQLWVSTETVHCWYCGVLYTDAENGPENLWMIKNPWTGSSIQMVPEHYQHFIIDHRFLVLLSAILISGKSLDKFYVWDGQTKIKSLWRG